MKVGIDVSQAIYGTGVSDYVVNIVKHLPTQDLVLWGGSLRRGSDIKALFPQALVSPLPPTAAHWLWNNLHLFDVQHLTGPVDVWHSSDWAQPPTRAKKVTTVHDLSPFLYPAELDPQIVAVQTARMKWVQKECDQIICVSKNTADDLKRLFKVTDDRIKIIYEALPDRFLMKPQTTKQTNYIMTIGARQPRKNMQRLISAFQTYKDKLALPPKLIIVGESAVTVSDPSIQVTGYVSDQQLVDLLAGASVFVYPSLYEGFGLPVLGAFHFLVPVACADTSSLPEVAGDAAEYFDPLNEEQIAKAIAEAVANKSKLVAAGKLQLGKFSWDKAAAETYAVYKQL
ncbi:MAG: glycosyltransferase family 1 protein [bacterium]|nr:glycosyltransferase family 1 protein [bacterium]